MSELLPEWPEKTNVSALGSQFTLEEVIAVAGYEHAYRMAAMARLRVAVEKLALIRESHACTGRVLADIADQALQSVGEIPRE
jgi:hypothetical protein